MVKVQSVQRFHRPIVTKIVDIEAHGCEQFAQSHLAAAPWPGIELATGRPYTSDALPLRHHATLSATVVIPPPLGERNIAMSVSVSVCACLSVRDHILGTTHPIFTKFLCMLLMIVARSSSGGVVILYVLPVLWMTSYLFISQGCSTSTPS